MNGDGCSFRFQLTPYPILLPSCSILFVEATELATNTETTLAKVLTFVGADPALAPPPRTPPQSLSCGARRGRRMHPRSKAALQAFYREPTLQLYSMLGRDFGWSIGDGSWCGGAHGARSGDNTAALATASSSYACDLPAVFEIAAVPARDPPEHAPVLVEQSPV